MQLHPLWYSKDMNSVAKSARVLFLLPAIALAAGCSTPESGGKPGTSSEGGAKARGGKLRVAAAASLTAAFEEVGEAFKAKTGCEVVLSLSASGKLAAQIEQGAPFDVFASADESWIDKLIAKKALDAGSKQIYAVGRLVIWVSGRQPPDVASLAQESYKKIALANPDHAPYGRAAKEALQKAGVWTAVESRIVQGSNVKQALQFAETGNAEAALTALSLVVGTGKGSYTKIPREDHSALPQVAAVVAGSKEKALAKEFLEFLESNEAKVILKRYGYDEPGPG